MSPPTALAEPFEDVDRQHEAVRFGLWMFLATEILFFGGFFFLYSAARLQDPAGFAAGARRTELLLGTINTLLLLTSSATLSVAERATQVGWRGGARGGIVATLALGTAFLAVKGYEYHADLSENLFPAWSAFPFDSIGATRFWSFYWLITLIHAAHLTIGLGLVARLLWLDWRGRLLPHWMAAEATTLYWHFVDVIWLLLWALLYLVGR